MRWVLGLTFLLACAHDPGVAERSDYGAPPARARSAEVAQALSIKQALDVPFNHPMTVVAFLCQDFSHRECPPCPPGANCARCLPRTWEFCDDPASFDPMLSLVVEDPPFNLSLQVGHRYLLRGLHSMARGLSLDDIKTVD